MIQIQKFTPQSPILQGILDHFLLMETDEKLIVQTIPNGRVDAWFNLFGDFGHLNYQAGKRLSVPDCGFFGLSNQSQFFETQQGFKTISIKFFPQILILPLFQPLIQAKSYIDWQAIFELQAFNHLKLAIATSPTIEVQIQSLEAFFEKNLFTKSLGIEKSMELLAEMTALMEQPQTIQETAQAANISVKTLERKFKKHIGLNPKEFYKLLRFQKASQQIQAQNELGNINFSEKLGLVYYDQSHFIKECKSITGLSPKSFFKKLPPLMTDLVIQ